MTVTKHVTVHPATPVLTNDGVTSTPVLVTGDVGGVGGADGQMTVVSMVTTLGDDAHW